jgi:hypothetical protein
MPHSPAGSAESAFAAGVYERVAPERGDLGCLLPQVWRVEPRYLSQVHP